MDEQLFDIAWDEKAIEALKTIFYWCEEHVSKEKAIALRTEIISAVQRLALHPEIFPIELSLQGLSVVVRYIRVRNYKVLYYFDGNGVYVLHIHNIKQNPDAILKGLKDL